MVARDLGAGDGVGRAGGERHQRAVVVEVATRAGRRGRRAAAQRRGVGRGEGPRARRPGPRRRRRRSSTDRSAHACARVAADPRRSSAAWRSRRSSSGIVSARSRASAEPASSYGLTRIASPISAAAPGELAEQRARRRGRPGRRRTPWRRGSCRRGGTRPRPRPRPRTAPRARVRLTDRRRYTTGFQSAVPSSPLISPDELVRPRAGAPRTAGCPRATAPRPGSGSPCRAAPGGARRTGAAARSRSGMPLVWSSRSTATTRLPARVAGAQLLDPVPDPAGRRASAPSRAGEIPIGRALSATTRPSISTRSIRLSTPSTWSSARRNAPRCS